MAEPRRSESTSAPTPSQRDAQRHRGDGVRDQAEHLVYEVKHLREIADEGESQWTPAIVGGAVFLMVIPIVTLVIGIAFAFYYWA